MFNLLALTFIPLAFLSVVAILATASARYLDEITSKAHKIITIISVITLITSITILTIIL